MGPPDAVLELIERFARNREQYLNPAYNETQARRELLDPFFTALGWDVDNRAGYAQQYKDVVHEDAIKVGLDARAPDYSFRVGLPQIRRVRTEIIRGRFEADETIEAIADDFSLKRGEVEHALRYELWLRPAA